MPDRMRWRYGDTNPVMAAVDADTVIEIGDLVWQDGDDAKPAAAIEIDKDAWTAGELRQSFTGRFLGAAMQRSRKGDTAPIRVATSGVFEFERDPGTCELGDWYGAAIAAAPLTLLSQSVEPVAAASQAIGRCARRAEVMADRILLEIRSTVMYGGVAGSVGGGQ